MKIGRVSLPHGLILGPMAGYSDHAMRAVCHRFGAEYAVSEMISAKAVCYGDRKTFDLAKIAPDEGPVALQIFGSEPDIMAQAAAVLTERREEGCVSPAAIDINMGCPAPKIFNNGEGSALMRNPDLIFRIVSAVRSATALPLTVKIRAGVDPDHINAEECAKAAEAGGADLLCVHGRTRTQMYSGSADRFVIRRVKESLRIPVIANGDVTSAESALSMLRETGADGLMIARGAVGNPFLFGAIAAAMEGKTAPEIGTDERISVALWQLRMAIEEKGEHRAVCEARKQIALYFSGFRGSAAFRDRVHRAGTYEEVEEALASLSETADF